MTFAIAQEKAEELPRRGRQEVRGRIARRDPLDAPSERRFPPLIIHVLAMRSESLQKNPPLPGGDGFIWIGAEARVAKALRDRAGLLVRL